MAFPALFTDLPPCHRLPGLHLPQHRVTDSASPPSEVSLYFGFMSLAVIAIAVTVLSKSTRRLAGISLLAIMYPVHALTAPYAQRSMQGICTKPATGSQVMPRWC